MIEVKAGYKQTEVGVIPEDWDVFNLDKLNDRIGDGIHSTPKYSTDGDYFFINGNNLNNGIIEITADTKRVSKNEYLIHKREINNTTVLLSINGTIGNIAFYNNENIILGKSAAYINLNNGLDKRYLYQIIQTEFIKKYFDNELTGSTIKNLGLGSIRNSPIPLPPSKSEQTAISTILSDTDALIDHLEKLIAKKKAIKQGAMQQLLTGKKRLPGFSGEWKIVPIKNLIKIPVTDGPHLTPKFIQNGIPFLSVNNLVNNKIDLSNLRYISKHDHDVFSKKCKPQKEDILLGKAASVGLVAVVDFDLDFNIWSPIALIRLSNQHVPKFIYYSFQCRYVINQIKLLTNSSSQGNIGMGDIEEIEFLVPTKSEQTAISTILSDTDALIDHLEKLIAKKKAIKQGAMQQLLTGKKRLPGFSGEWKIVPIKNLIKIPVTDGPHLTPKFIQNGIPFLSVNNLVNNKIDLSNLRYISKHDHDVFSKKCKPQKEDILLGKAASVGLVAVVDFDLDFNIWSPIALIRLSNQHVPKFIYYSFQCRYVINQIKLLTNSSSQGNIGMGDIEEIEFLVPTKSEQSAIATILSDMDAEIEALERKRDKYTMIKQGMMQQLLTGRIRVHDTD